MHITLSPYSKAKLGYTFSWNILADGKRAGNVHIGKDTSRADDSRDWITIHVNQALRGKGVGTEAYRQACEQSGLPIVYAHMRKSNLASRRAAEKAGFQVIEDDQVKPQLCLIWVRG
jgi:RimJ/RimL family protein N-acetyltransferase